MGKSSRLRKAFTLVEIVVSAIIFSIMASGILSSFLFVRSWNIVDQHKLTATNFAKETLERLYLTADTDELSSGSHETECAVADHHLNPPISIVPVQLPTGGLTGELRDKFSGARFYSVDATNPEKLDVTVTVTWIDYNGPQTVNLYGLILVN